MVDAKTLRTKVEATNEELKKEKLKKFNITGTRLIFDGWLKIFSEGRGSDQILPELKKGDELDILKLNIEKKETLPPNRYSEAGLVKEMEARGIGRPSTYASTIKTLKDRNYVEVQGRTLYPTDIGMTVSTFLEENFKKYISDEFTANMEDELDLLAVGKDDYVKLLQNFYDKFTEEIKSKKDIAKITNIGKVGPEFPCPECGKEMV